MVAVTSDELVVGIAADLLQGNAANMQAAGSVEIRTTESPVTVLDAAVAGRGQLQVRAGATANLAGTYAQNTPGITPSTITAAANGSIDDDVVTSYGNKMPTSVPARKYTVKSGQPTAANERQEGEAPSTTSVRRGAVTPPRGTTKLNGATTSLTRWATPKKLKHTVTSEVKGSKMLGIERNSTLEVKTMMKQRLYILCALHWMSNLLLTSSCGRPPLMTPCPYCQA